MKDNNSKHKNPFSSRAFKKGSQSILFTVIALVAVILLNIVVTAVNDRYPFSVDLTANKDYTIELEKEHEDFIKSIDTDITITVCAAEDDFEDAGNFAYNMASTLQLVDNYYGSLQDVTNKYARQTAMFVKTFAAMNSHIKVEFKNSNSVTDFSSVKSRFPNETLSYGDIIVSCTHTTESGDTFDRYQILGISDIFSTEANSSLQNYTYYVNSIKGSTLATDITSALYIVTSAESVELALIGGHGTATSDSSTAMSGLRSLLNKNNYTFTEVESLLTDSIPDTAAAAIIFRPTSDYSSEEIKVLSDYLVNGGNYGKNLVFVPSATQPDMPNLEEFLLEWGIQMLPAISYDDTQGEYYYSYNYIFANTASSDYTKDLNTDNGYFYPSTYRLAKAAFTENGTRTTEEILVSADTTVGMPLDPANDWTRADAEYTGPFDLVLMGSDYGYTNDTDMTEKSRLVMISGDYLFEDQVLSTSACLNASFTIGLFNSLVGVDDSGTAVEITEKVISTDSFSDVLVNSYAPDIVYIVFVAIIPIALVVTGIVIWNRRRKRV